MTENEGECGLKISLGTMQNGRFHYYSTERTEDTTSTKDLYSQESGNIKKEIKEMKACSEVQSSLCPSEQESE